MHQTPDYEQLARVQRAEIRTMKERLAFLDTHAEALIEMSETIQTELGLDLEQGGDRFRWRKVLSRAGKLKDAMTELRGDLREEIAELTEWAKEYDELAQAGKGADSDTTSDAENTSGDDGVAPGVADDTETAAAPAATW